MNDFVTAHAWADAQSFTAKIFLASGNRRVPISHVNKFYGPVSLSRGTGTVRTDDGWLRANNSEEPAIFFFEYHSQTPNRLNFMISLASDRGRKLGLSRNGFLGLYHYAEVNDFWKLEPLNWESDSLHCLIRDHQGHRVTLETSTAHLTINGESAIEFLIVRTEA
ncbi:hypothetical protein [Pseudomonas sp. NBRC 111124]|uniref:hypothetical protein n=1 Tax=Pseudomonas sp. NBRC 111124 TaxID=1661039 RepID=UPI000760DF0E|nr:hypothetical protein [Pseudomonas sp. NBRC 111124]